MDQIFLVKLLLSFVIGGLWVITVTIAADKLGSKVGGLIGGLPSTALFGLLFIALTQNAQSAINATTIIPAAFGIEVIFLWGYIYFLKNNIWSALSKSFLIYLITASTLFFIKIDSIILSCVIYIVFFVFSILFFKKFVHVQSVASKNVTYTPKIILLRGLLSATIVASVVLLAKFGGPTLAGIAASFPALFASTLIIVYFSQGKLFSKSLAKTFTFSAVSTVAYVLAVRYTYVPLGIWFGTIFSIVISLLSGAFLYQLILKRIE